MKKLDIENLSTDNENLNTILSSSSKGNQIKWYDSCENRYIKQDTNGNESIAEWIISKILRECSNIPAEEITEYHLCTVDKIPGCFSYEFKNEGEDELTLFTILHTYGISFKSMSHSEMFYTIVDAVKDYTMKDFEYELKRLFAIDAIFLNTDRHTSNIAMLEDSEGKYWLSPIFDNGLSLLSNKKGVTIFSIDSVVRKLKPSLLKSNFKTHAEFYDYEPFLNKTKTLELIEEYKEVLGDIYYVLQHQIKQKHLQHLMY